MEHVDGEQVSWHGRQFFSFSHVQSIVCGSVDVDVLRTAYSRKAKVGD